MDVRRVVTGHDTSGKSVFVSDEAVAAQPLTGFHRLWGGDKTPQFPDDGSMPAEKVADAIKKYGIDAAKPAPWTV